jgi:hypothetical protein
MEWWNVGTVGMTSKSDQAVLFSAPIIPLFQYSIVLR